MLTLNETLILLQEVYDEYFSFLGFDEFLRDRGQSVATAFCHIGTHASFDPIEISRHDNDLKSLMKARLIDALVCAQDKISEDIKRIEGIK